MVLFFLRLDLVIVNTLSGICGLTQNVFHVSVYTPHLLLCPYANFLKKVGRQAKRIIFTLLSHFAFRFELSANGVLNCGCKSSFRLQFHVRSNFRFGVVFDDRVARITKTLKQTPQRFLGGFVQSKVVANGCAIVTNCKVFQC